MSGNAHDDHGDDHGHGTKKSQTGGWVIWMLRIVPFALAAVIILFGWRGYHTSHLKTEAQSGTAAATATVTSSGTRGTPNAAYQPLEIAAPLPKAGYVHVPLAPAHSTPVATPGGLYLCLEANLDQDGISREYHDRLSANLEEDANWHPFSQDSLPDNENGERYQAQKQELDLGYHYVRNRSAC